MPERAGQPGALRDRQLRADTLLIVRVRVRPLVGLDERQLARGRRRLGDCGE